MIHMHGQTTMSAVMVGSLIWLTTIPLQKDSNGHAVRSEAMIQDARLVNTRPKGTLRRRRGMGTNRSKIVVYEASTCVYYSLV